MSGFLVTSELTESKASIRSFVKEIKVRPGKATIRYILPTPEDSPIRGERLKRRLSEARFCLQAGMWYPRGDSNSRLWLRRPALYPLSYGGIR